MSDKRTEIEVTPEMIEAGAAAFFGYDPDFDDGGSIVLEIMTAVFKANPAGPVAVSYSDPDNAAG